MDKQEYANILLRLAGQSGAQVEPRGERFDVQGPSWSGTYTNDASGLATAVDHLQRRIALREEEGTNAPRRAP